MSLKWTPKKVRADWGGGYGDPYGGVSYYGPDQYVLEKATETPVDVKAAREQATESARGFGRGVLAGAPRMLLQLPMKAAEGYVQLAYLLAGADDAVLDLERYSPADMVGRGITEMATSILPHGRAWDPSRKDLVDAAVGGEVLGEVASPFMYQGAAKGIVKIGEALPKGSRSGSIAPEMLGLESAPPKQPVVGSSSVTIEAPPKPADPEALAAYRARLAEDAARKAASDPAARVAATRYASATDRVAAAQLKAMQAQVDAAAARAAERQTQELARLYTTEADAVSFVEDPVGYVANKMPEAPGFVQKARATMWENMFPGQSISAEGLPGVPGTGSTLLHFARSATRPALTAYGASVVAKGGAMLYRGWADAQVAYMDQAMADAQDKAFRDFVTAKGGVTPENAAELARDLAHVWTPERQASIELAAKRAMAKDLFGPRLDVAVPTKKPVWVDSAPRSSGSSPRETGADAPTQPTGRPRLQSQVPAETMTPAQRLEKVWAEAPDVYEAGVRRWMAEQASDRANAILLEDQKTGRVRTRKFQEKLAKRDVADPATSRILFGTDDITDFETVAGFSIPDEYFTGGQ